MRARAARAVQIAAALVACSLNPSGGAQQTDAGGASSDGAKPATDWPDPAALRWRNTLVIGGAAAALGAFGASRWWKGSFEGTFKNQGEGWFGRSTTFAGVDKFGHAYSTMVGVRLLTPALQWAGNDVESARRLAVISTFAAFAAIEVIDGYSSRYTFSREDLIVDALGVMLGYAFEANPRLDEVLDFRLNYRQSKFSSFSPLEDYDGQRYFLVFKPDGVPALRDVPGLKYLEFNLGYGATGFDVFKALQQPRIRSVYAGVSLNLSRLLADGFYGGQRGSTRSQRVADGVFEFVQFNGAKYARYGIDN